jgi:hypothetical protein
LYQILSQVHCEPLATLSIWPYSTWGISPPYKICIWIYLHSITLVGNGMIILSKPTFYHSGNQFLHSKYTFTLSVYCLSWTRFTRGWHYDFCDLLFSRFMVLLHFVWHIDTTFQYSIYTAWIFSIHSIPSTTSSLSYEI